MNSTHLTASRRPPRRTSRSRRTAAPAAAPTLRWIHDGVRCRVVASTSILFQQESTPEMWIDADLPDDVFASTALAINGAQWREFLDFLPRDHREFLARFSFSRMAALHVITRCPLLVADLSRVPALTAFVAAHLTLRGGERPAWGEIAAVHEREGLFGLLQWLGLPASPQTVAILQSIADPDLPARLLQPLRAALWEPEVIWALSRAPALTDQQLMHACHALAA